MNRLKIERPGPGYFNFPDWVTEDYFGQLTAESKVPVKNRKTGKIRWEWIMNQTRNEALDLTVYAHAALWILQKVIDKNTYENLSTLLASVQEGNQSAGRSTNRLRRVISSGI